jgi:drug/metabolite transporter (DMT)-like permease
MSSYLLGILAGIGAMFGWGIGEATAKLAVQHTSEFVAYFWVEMVVALVFSSVGLAHGVQYLPITPLLIGAAIFVAETYTIAYLNSYRAYSIGKLALVSPILCSYGMLSSVLAAIFLHQRLTLPQFVAIAIIVGSTLLLSIDFTALKRGVWQATRGVKEAIIAFIFFGVNSVCLDYIAERYDIHLLNMLISLLSLAMIGVYLVWKKIPLQVPTLPRETRWYILLTGVLTLVANYSFIYRYQIGDSIVIAPLGAASGTVTALISLIVFREKLSLLQLVAVASSFVGIILLAAL